MVYNCCKYLASPFGDQTECPQVCELLDSVENQLDGVERQLTEES